MKSGGYDNDCVDAGVSGEVPGVSERVEQDSTREAVVVGEEFAESDVVVEILS